MAVMHPPARLLMNVPRAHSAARIFGAAVICFGTTGCVGNPFAEARVDASSPIAAEVARTAHLNGDYPSFQEIPAKPNDVRPVKMFGVAAGKVEQARADLERNTAPESWTLNDSSSFAAKAEKDAGPDLGAPNPADTAAFAEALRKRATPPPPPKR